MHLPWDIAATPTHAPTPPQPHTRRMYKNISARASLSVQYNYGFIAVAVLMKPITQPLPGIPIGLHYGADLLDVTINSLLLAWIDTEIIYPKSDLNW